MPFMAPFAFLSLLEPGTQLLPFLCLKNDLPFRQLWAWCCHRGEDCTVAHSCRTSGRKINVYISLSWERFLK